MPLSTDDLERYIEGKYANELMVSPVANPMFVESGSQEGRSEFSTDLDEAKAEGEVQARDKLGKQALIPFEFFLILKLVYADIESGPGYSTNKFDGDDDSNMYLSKEEEIIIFEQGMSEIIEVGQNSSSGRAWACLQGSGRCICSPAISSWLRK